MGKLLPIWSYLKTHAVLLGIFVAVLTFSVGASYFWGLGKGEKNGRAACEARYEKEKVQGFQAVTARLTEINERNSQLVAQWEEQNRLTTAALERRVENTYKVVEKIVEKPVPVTGDCRIDYSVVGVLNDAARGSADGN